MASNDVFLNTTVNLVDYDPTTGSLLVRGNMPRYQATDGNYYFAYDQILNALQALPNLPVSSSSLSDYYLFDVSLIDNQGDYDIFCDELAAFGLIPYTQSPPASLPIPFSYWPPYPTSYTPAQIQGTQVQVAASDSTCGGMVWWPIEPFTLTPPPSPNIDFYVDTAGGFQFAGLVEYLNELLTSSAALSSPPATPYLIYFHCDSGVNRTGALNMGYFMTYGSYFFNCTSMTAAEAYANANSIAPGANQSPSQPEIPCANALILAQCYCNYMLTGSPDNDVTECVLPPPTSSPI